MNEIILHLSAGQGPEECQWVVAQLAHAFCREAMSMGLTGEPVEPVDGPSASILIRISGEGSDGFARARTGTIRWIGTSPFRPTHKRRNWFVGVKPVPTIEDIPDFRDADIRYQTLRASGPGGQHVNKTDSAVRATHVPTGLTSVSQDQRSQFANRKIARLKLAMQFDEQRRQGVAGGKRALWTQNQELERGNAVRTYEGLKFQPGLR
ncbi:MAG: peptide chain release factor H [Sphingomonas sp.]|jgi:peptide chain release factor|uniref:peptide chain release factor H n=1 Tax=Sphingomonas sp. TaxID=28214 RepID=UPI0035646FEC